MISCDFNGRLGNNMFQIANVLSIATKLNEPSVFHPHTFAGHRGDRQSDLSMFAYDFPRGIESGTTRYSETDKYQPVPVRSNTTYCGFYQDYRYFEDIKTTLLGKYFAPSNDVLEGLSKYTITDNCLGICVRRGDYLMLQHNHCVLSAGYYQSAINQYFSEVDQVFVFSDDYDWCKETFGSQVEYVDDTVGVQLFLMSKMKHLILANSTFSWWGAYLNQLGGTIIMPDPWYGPQCTASSDGLKYPGWIQQKHNIEISPFRVDHKMYN